MYASQATQVLALLTMCALRKIWQLTNTHILFCCTLISWIFLLIRLVRLTNTLAWFVLTFTQGPGVLRCVQCVCNPRCLKMFTPHRHRTQDNCVQFYKVHASQAKSLGLIIHRVKWRHVIYGYDTFTILWVWFGIMCAVNGWRFTMLFK